MGRVMRVSVQVGDFIGWCKKNLQLQASKKNLHGNEDSGSLAYSQLLCSCPASLWGSINMEALIWKRRTE